MIIDAHVHLWKKQNGLVDGLPVYPLENGRSMLKGEVRQMLPPYMTDNRNTVARLIANMDFALVSGAVVTQEYMDGNQDAYLRYARRAYPDRLRVCALYEEKGEVDTRGMDGIKIVAERLRDRDLTHHAAVFAQADREGKFISTDLYPGDEQAASLREMIEQYPNLRVAIGHFAMITVAGWQEVVKLARHPNVRIESGGITWLFNSEYYPYPSAVKAICAARDICGMDKLMWGSDYPRTMTAITYRMSWDFLERTSLLTPEEKNLFLYENAHAFYGFGNLPAIQPVRHMAE